MSNDVNSWTGNADHHSQYTQQWVDANSSAYASLDKRSVIPEAQDQGFATQLYRTCLHVFRHLYNEAIDHNSQGLRLSSLKDELAKLYLWGEDFGGAELDDVLEHSEDVRKVVLELLGDIGRTLLRERKASLLKAGAKLSPQYDPSASLPAQEQTVELRKLLDQIKSITNIKSDNETREDHIFCVDSDDTDEDSSSDDDDPHDTLEDLEFSTRRLVELGPALHQNLYYVEKARLQFSRPPAVPFSVSEPAWIYVSHVREKFNQAQTRLVERLGEANWQRHRDVRRRMDAIANPNEDHEDEHEHGQGDGITCSVFYPSVAYHDSGIGTSIPAQTFYAQSHTSFQSNNTEGEQGSLRVPDTPTEVSEGKAFKCFLCGQMLSKIKNRVDWKLHVFADLKPYICTFTDCEHELAQFQNRAAWAEHEFNEHRLTKLWICPECLKEYPSLATWEAHLQEQHKRIFSGPHRQLAQKMAYRPQERPIEVEECPLCRSVLGKPRREFVKHVGRHMEQIALVVLPREATDDSDAESACTTQENSSHASIGSKRQSPRRSDKSHMETPEEATYRECQVCGKLFQRSYNWKAHMETHNPERKYPYPCTAMVGNAPCTKSFQRKIALDRHFDSVHLKARNHRCALCGIRFARRDTLRRHTEDGCPKRFELGLVSPEGTMAANHIRFNNQYYTQREVEIACALKIYLYKSDETICTILGFRQNGIGGPPIPCAGLVSSFQGTNHPVYRRVYNNGAYWEPEANRIYREWMGAVSETVRSTQSERAYPYHVENDTMGAAAAAAGNQLEMNNLEAIDEQETGTSNTALDRQSKDPDHVDFAPKTEAQASQGDAVIIGYMGGLNHPDLASKAGEEPLSRESDESADEDGTSPRDNQAGEEPFLEDIGESADEDKVGSETGPDALGLFLAAASGSKISTSPREYQYGPAGKKSLEALHLETPNRSDPFVQQADVSVDEKSQGLTRGEKRRNFQNLLKDSQAPSVENLGFESISPKLQPTKSQPSSRYKLDSRPQFTALASAEQEAAQVSAQMIELGYETTENRITVALPKKTQQQVTGPHLGTFLPKERSRTVFATRKTVKEKEQREMQARQQAVKKTRERRMLTPSQGEKVAATRKVVACSDCRRRKKRCTHGLPGDSMNREEPTETPPPPTTSTIPFSDHLPHTPQTTKPTSEAINNPTKPTNIDPSQNLSSNTSDDPRSRIPPFPLYRPVGTSTYGLDECNSPDLSWEMD